MNEDRYLQPILCFAFILAISFIFQLFRWIQKKRGAISTS
jgi:hypothetical protein